MQLGSNQMNNNLSQFSVCDFEIYNFRVLWLTGVSENASVESFQITSNMKKIT